MVSQLSGKDERNAVQNSYCLVVIYVHSRYNACFHTHVSTPHFIQTIWENRKNT